MMDKETVRNMLSSIPKTKFEKLVHLVGFVIRIVYVKMHGPLNVKFGKFDI